MSKLKAVVCSVLLITLMFTAYMFVQNWVYPKTVEKPFGETVFIGAALGIFAVVITLTYLLLKLVLML